MTNQEILIEILQKLAANREQKEVYALPERPRSLATKNLESEEITHLARHIIKITLWSQSSYYTGWMKEIKASLDNLAFKLCRISLRKNKKRIIKSLWYGATDIMNKLNYNLDDAYWDVIDDMDSMIDQIEFDPFIEKEGQNFSTIGFELKEGKDEDSSIYFTLWLNNKRIA